jgi:hypothetical protein
MNFVVPGRPGALTPEERAELRLQVTEAIRGLFIGTIAKASVRIVEGNLAGIDAYKALREETLDAIARLDVLVDALDIRYGADTH